MGQLYFTHNQSNDRCLKNLFKSKLKMLEFHFFSYSILTIIGGSGAFRFFLPVRRIEIRSGLPIWPAESFSSSNGLLLTLSCDDPFEIDGLVYLDLKTRVGVLIDELVGISCIVLLNRPFRLKKLPP